MTSEIHSREDRLAYGVMDVVRLVRDDDAYAMARLPSHRQARARALVKQVADYWGFSVQELAKAALEALGDITGIKSVEQARMAAFDEESERRRERQQDNERMEVIRQVPGARSI